MKKYFLIILCLFLTIGCSKGETIEDKEEDAKEEQTVITEPEEKYEDDNPIKVGLYLKGKLVHEYNRVFTPIQDLESFDVYFTNEEDVGGTNTKNNFNRYYNNYENIGDYKVGFEISFDVGEEHHNNVILDPDVEVLMAPYLFLYLYDDVHQPDGSWYSHVTKDDYNENTIFSSIKLFMANNINDITSPITLKVFTYNDEEDFDETGHYRGISSYSITIYNR